MAKALHKVQKQIAKKRGGKPNSLHQHSRDSQRLRTAGAREDKLAKLGALAANSNRKYGEHQPSKRATYVLIERLGVVDRVAFFQSALAGSTGPLPAEEFLLITLK